MPKMDMTKATRTLRTMEERFKVLKSEVKYKECIGFDDCMELFKEHFSDQLRREAEYMDNLVIKKDRQ
jgi:hypothetical protein